jgi:hypothetical protein
MRGNGIHLCIGDISPYSIVPQSVRDNQSAGPVEGLPTEVPARAGRLLRILFFPRTMAGRSCAACTRLQDYSPLL